jgi:transcription antitermination factor NusA-like protein
MNQRQAAIGKNAQNVRLAARLTGWKIGRMSATEYVTIWLIVF